MACLILVSRLSLFMLVFCFSAVRPAPHIIGGGWNTIIGGNDNRAQISDLHKSAFSSRRQSGIDGNVLSNTNTRSGSDDDRNSYIDDNNSNLPAASVDHSSEVRLPPPAMSGLQQVNPLFRLKRQDCQIPANLGSNVNQLKDILNSTQFLRSMASGFSIPEVPTDQPAGCPDESNPWWPGTTPNLRSNCPWTYSKRDLGQGAYPRYVLEADCLCQNCISATDMQCQKIWQNVTYFEHQGCQNGLALMVKQTTSVAVGCHCVHSQPSATMEYDE